MYGMQTANERLAALALGIEVAHEALCAAKEAAGLPLLGLFGSTAETESAQAVLDEARALYAAEVESGRDNRWKEDLAAVVIAARIKVSDRDS